MAAKRGSELLIKRGDGATPTEAFTTIGALQSATLTINGNAIDVTTADDVDVDDILWRASINGVKSMSISGNGIGKAIEPIQSLYEDFAGDVIRNVQVIVPYVGTWVVPVIITNMTFNGPYDGVSGFDITMEGAGAPSFTAEA